MRTVRVGALIGVAVVGMGFGLAATDCASATTITIDVRTRPELCGKSELGIQLNETGIAAASTSKYKNKEKAPLQITTRGCKNAATGSIGTLVITPSDSKTEQIGIRVVSALGNNTAEACDAEDPSKPKLNCIIAVRLARFSEGQNVPVTVTVDPDCNGVQCDEGLTCVKGGCVKPEEIPVNPEEVPDANAFQDSQGTSDAEPPKDAAADDGAACNKCSGNGYVGCDAGTCVIDCSTVNCRNGNVACPDNRLSCTHLCRNANDCNRATCGAANPNTCRFECGGVGDGTRCSNITCDAGKCEFECKEITNACTEITMFGKKSVMTCTATGPNDSPSCDRVTCEGPECVRTCEKDAGCGTTSACDGGCVNFRQNDGGPPDAGEAGAGGG